MWTSSSLASSRAIKFSSAAECCYYLLFLAVVVADLDEPSLFSDSPFLPLTDVDVLRWNFE